MGGTVNAAEAAVRNAQSNAQGAAAEQQQGVLDGRQVSDQRQGTDGPSLRERQQAGAVSGDTAEQTSLHSRQATVVSPDSFGTDSATGPSPEERTGKPPATTATAAPLGSASASTVPADRLAQVLAPPDLQPIVLTNAQGVTLFRGVRHGILIANEVDLPLLQRVPNDQLKSLFESLEPELWTEHPGLLTSEFEFRFSRIRDADTGIANSYVRHLNRCVVNHLAREVAVAAIATDPEKLGQALNGKTVDLNLCTVSLLNPAELEVSKPQMTSYHALTRPSLFHQSADAWTTPDESAGSRAHLLRLCDSEGASRVVRANINVRPLTLTSAGESINAIRSGPSLNQPKDELKKLLGAIGGHHLTRDAPRQADPIDAGAPESFAPPLSRALGQISAASGHRADHADLQQLRNALVGNHESIETELNSLSRDSRTLTEAAAQLKAIWPERGDWLPGADTRLRAAALIALATHRMGETPVLISGDKDVAERLEAEVKYLATYADSHEGHLPAFDSRVQE